MLEAKMPLSRYTEPLPPPPLMLLLLFIDPAALEYSPSWSEAGDRC